MRLALHRRQIEVEVLKLVGATDRFVRGPFVEGAVKGRSARARRSLSLGVLYMVVRGRFDDDLGLLLGVNPTFLPWEIVVGDDRLGGLARRSLRLPVYDASFRPKHVAANLPSGSRCARALGVGPRRQSRQIDSARRA